jgi:hypothetical protein
VSDGDENPWLGSERLVGENELAMFEPYDARRTRFAGVPYPVGLTNNVSTITVPLACHRLILGLSIRHSDKLLDVSM